jgi:SnoaL-like domain
MTTDELNGVPVQNPETATSIERYFDLAAKPDSDAYFSQFSEDAVLEDEGKRYRGLEEIRSWRRGVPLVTYEVRHVGGEQPVHDAHVEITTAGGTLMLRFGFTFAADGRIRSLRIRP